MVSIYAQINMATHDPVRNQSLITGRGGGGGLQNGRGCKSSFTPTKERGGGVSFSHAEAEGKHKKVSGSFNTRA